MANMMKLVFTLGFLASATLSAGPVAAQQTPVVPPNPPAPTDKTSPPEKISPPANSPAETEKLKNDERKNAKDSPPIPKSGVITPPKSGDSAIQVPTPDPGPNSMPVIHPPSGTVKPQ